MLGASAQYRFPVFGSMKLPDLLFEGEELAPFVDKGSLSVSQNDIWIFFEQPDASLEVGPMVDAIVGRPLK